MADPRPFIKLHNGFPEHPKTAGLSDRGFRNLIELWCYCSRNLTDGFVPNAVANKILSQKSRRELAEVGYITEGSAEVEMVGYLDHQMSAKEVADLREHRAEAGRKGGKAKAKRLASAKANAKQTSSKSVADLDTDTDTDTTSSSEAADATPTREDVNRLCNRLADHIEANTGKRPNITKGWRDAARLLMDRDGRTEQQVAWMIDWCQRDEFWHTNILSMPKLREKFDQLLLKARPAQQKPGLRLAANGEPIIPLAADDRR